MSSSVREKSRSFLIHCRLPPWRMQTYIRTVTRPVCQSVFAILKVAHDGVYCFLRRTGLIVSLLTFCRIFSWKSPLNGYGYYKKKWFWKSRQCSIKHPKILRSVRADYLQNLSLEDILVSSFPRSIKLIFLTHSVYHFQS